MGADAIEDLATTTACLDRLAADQPLSWQFDPTLVRGMGYYTGQIFEISHPGCAARSPAAAATTSSSAARWTGTCPPADSPSGSSGSSTSRAQCPPGTVALLVEADVPTIEILATARGLRSEGLAIETIRRSGKFGAQLTRLEARVHRVHPPAQRRRRYHPR
jgi:histidyl-tRNA synthetase